MPLFICEKCGCIENTALGHYWSKDTQMFKNTEWGKALCSECSPNKFPDGSNYAKGGKWHGQFPKESFEEYMKAGGKREYVLNAP